MIDLIRNGVAYSLDDGTYATYIDDEGFDLAPLHRLVERGPLQHGETDRGFRLDPRLGTLVLQLPPASGRSAAKTHRQALLGLFAPGYTQLALRWTWDDGAVRQIDVHPTGLIGEHMAGYNRRVAVTLRAPDPTFYDPAGKAVTFRLGGGGDALEVPLEVPMVVGASVIDAATVVTNDGDWLSYPHLIRITGPIEDVMITNETTGEVLSFDGVAIAAGDHYDLDLRYGHKTVVDSTGANKIADLTEDSDLATWHLEPGANSIRVTGLDATEATKVEISFFERYIGI
jgi:hypothetical protein